MAFYLDLFNGDPEAGGQSVLAAITGSAVRPDVTDDLVITATGDYVNPDTIAVAAASLNQTNISWVAIYDAATSGTLLKTLRLGASPTIAKNNPVEFAALALNLGLIPSFILLAASIEATFSIACTMTSTGTLFGQWDFTTAVQSAQILTCGL